jgi:hypothetical protein
MAEKVYINLPSEPDVANTTVGKLFTLTIVID